jgi:hypothetical protein
MTSRQSVEPLLEFMSYSGTIDYVHRNVATKDEFCYYLDRWFARGMSKYRLGYLGFHGSRSTLHLSRKVTLTLDELGDLLKGRCKGRILYFGSCSTLAVPDDQLMDFCRRTGARGLIGYTKDVGFMETAGFEIIMLTEVVYSTNFRSVYTRLCREHPVLTRRLGLRMAHSKWASERSVALDALKAK